MAALRQLAGNYPISGFAAQDNKYHSHVSCQSQPFNTLVLSHLGPLRETGEMQDQPAKAEKMPLLDGSVAAHVIANSEQ